MNRALGRLPAKRPVGLRDLRSYVGGLDTAPEVFDFTGTLRDWKMLGNGPDPTLTISSHPLGDCAFAGAAHLVMATAVETHQTIPAFTSDEVAEAYLRFTNGVDSGACLADVLAVWRQLGLWGARIDGYAPTPLQDLWDATYAFGACYIGVAMPQSAMDQHERGESWTVVPSSPIVGGHCVVLVSRTTSGGEVITWGERQGVTDAWLETYVEEAWSVVTPEQGRGNGYDCDHQALIAELEALDHLR